jgi:hypothetical protein
VTNAPTVTARVALPGEPTTKRLSKPVLPITIPVSPITCCTIHMSNGRPVPGCVGVTRILHVPGSGTPLVPHPLIVITAS